jgi:DNA polymerase III subunit delta'
MADWSIEGHEWAVELLARSVAGEHYSHAYLFCGPAQIGKVTLARALARALFCERGRAGPCDLAEPHPCRACQLIRQERHSGVQLISPERSIQIEQVRVLQNDAALSPVEGRHKVFILREIERATPAAANALLKTLEEPPDHTILVLTCVRRDQVLPTIQSRCQVLPLRPLPLPQVTAALTSRWAVPPEQAALLAHLSGGRLGWAVAASGDPRRMEMRKLRLQTLRDLFKKDAAGRLTCAEELSKTPETVPEILSLWASWCRDLLLCRLDSREAIVNLDQVAELDATADLVSVPQLMAVLREISRTLRRVNANVNVRLALDVLTLRLPDLAQRV